jgi:hypothetical protein
MTLFELILAVVVIAAATVAAILNHLSPELAGILGVALGYVAKAAVNASPLPTNQASTGLKRIASPAEFKGAPPE